MFKLFKPTLVRTSLSSRIFPGYWFDPTLVHSSLARNPGPGGIPPCSRPGLVLLLELGCRTVPLSIAVRCDYQKRSLNYPRIWRSIHRKYVYDVYVLLWFEMFKVGCSKLLYVILIASMIHLPAPTYIQHPQDLAEDPLVVQDSPL
jgi:hypothetical protein